MDFSCFKFPILNRTFPSWCSLQFGCESAFRLDWLHIFNRVLHQVIRKDLWDSSKWNAVKEKKGKAQFLGWWPRGGSKSRGNQNMGYLASLWPVFPCTPGGPQASNGLNRCCDLSSTLHFGRMWQTAGTRSFEILKDQLVPKSLERLEIATCNFR